MKKFLFVLIVFSNYIICSQSLPINLASNKNYKKATVYFKNGSSKKGYADYNSLANHKVKFKELVSGKSKNYDSRKVKRLEFNLESSSYYYKKLGDTRKFILLKLVKEGEKMSLYTALSNVTQSVPFSQNTVTGGISINIFNKEQKFRETLFFAKTDDDKAFYFHDNTRDEKLKKTIRKYFSNCPKFVTKIDNNEFDKKDIIAVIDFYNSKCE